MGDIQGWDVTDASNTDLWPEGMHGADINDAGRSMQGVLARWFQDTNGSIAATGSSNAFAVTSKRTIAALTDNLIMAFTANFSITGAATLNLNSLGAKSIKRFNGSDLASGDIVSGQMVLVIYKTSTTTWYMISAPAALTGNMFVDLSENSSPGDPAADTARLFAKDESGTTNLLWSDSGSVWSGLRAATQAEMEAASSSLRTVSPARQHFHPGHPKATGRGAAAGGIVGTAYNVASIVRNSTGAYTVTLSNAMANTNYWVVAIALSSGSGGLRSVRCDVSSTTVFTVTIQSSGNSGSDEDFGFSVYGDM